MKKRITALLLCLVMVFSLIPTSVWASELPVDPTAVTPDLSTVKVQVKCSADSTQREYAITDADHGSWVYSSGTLGRRYCTTELKKANFIEKFNNEPGIGKTHADENPNDPVTAQWWWSDVTNNWEPVSKTIEIECTCDGTGGEIVPGAVPAPTKDDLKDCLVTVKCINPKVSNGTNCLDCQYGLWGGNSVGQFVKVSDTKYTVTIGAEGFLPGFQKRTGHEHDLYSAKTLTWVLTYEEGKWVANPETLGVDDTILVTHMPEATYDVLKGMQGVIKTRCVNKTTAYTEYGVIAGVVGESAQITKGEVSGTYNLTISTKNFADAASKHNDRVHDLLTGETANFVLSLSKNDASKYVWTATPVTDADGICEVAHRVKVTFDQNYTNAPAATEAMYKYDTAEVMEGAFPADPSRSGYVFQGWNTKADGTGDAFSNATAVTEDVTVYAQWGQLHPVQLVIYRNGDTSKAYKTVSLDPQLKGTPIDLTQLKISDYYTGNYEFYGWYNDGKWNEYTKNLANPPAGLEKITVNGWTNLKCMVYDYENVVYFQTKEAMEAYQADHSKTEGIVKSVKALHGSTLPTVDAPEATRAGYTFQHWSREGQSVNVTGQTVNGWTNLYGVWEITPHNIYAYARLNSYFAPLTPGEIDDDYVQLNAETLKRLELGSYNRLGFIPIGTFNFDGMPLTEEMYMAYYEDPELDAVADALMDAIDNGTFDLDTGVSSKAAAKIYDWTVLYKTFNEEDMAPGYITDDGEGYQLSGNLDLATVAFNVGKDADGKAVDPKDVKNMPAVNYTYEGFGIHDFYFTGNVFDLPENVPTREGYIFKGWRAERLGDIVVYSDPTTDAGAEGEKLWQPGDSGENGYSITAQGVIFYAVWEKAEYTIASDLRINGNVANLADGKTYAWTHRYSGKYEETIDYKPMIKALEDRTMAVDAANEPYSVEVKLCFPGTKDPVNATLYNETILTYGQKGGGWNPGVKNTAYIWGYATTFYKVTFNVEGNTDAFQKVEYNKQAVKPADPTRDGYKFTGWYDENGNLFDFATPITKSMTLTAGWEIIPHDIYAYARLNSSFGQLTTSEFGEDIKLNAETLKNLGLEIGYNANGYISIGKFTFNAMALTDDLYFDDETTAAVLEALKKDIVLETGVSADTAAKIAWTYLYQADDSKGSDYMYKSGYPTTDKDSYQLSGNLFLAAAMFDAGDVGEDEVKGMPAVNYTFDDVFAIHDFYLPGTEIELPALERTGYTFLGWEVKVIPSDDVANYADADAEKTLVEAGKYTITEGGAIFTAQWKINTYNVTFDSNGGSAVESQKVDYRAKVTKPAEPTREGYHFMGWFNGDKEWNFDEDTMGAGDMTLTAKWEINEYTVSFDSKGGTKVDSQIVKHGDTADKPGNPRRNGYVFKGWYLDGQKFDFSTPITGDITLTARWATKTSGGSNSSSDTTTKDNGKTVQSGKTFDGGIALYVGLSVLSATGSALVITKKKRG